MDHQGKKEKASAANRGCWIAVATILVTGLASCNTVLFPKHDFFSTAAPAAQAPRKPRETLDSTLGIVGNREHFLEIVALGIHSPVEYRTKTLLCPYFGTQPARKGSPSWLTIQAPLPRGKSPAVHQVAERWRSIAEVSDPIHPPALDATKVQESLGAWHSEIQEGEPGASPPARAIASEATLPASIGLAITALTAAIPTELISEDSPTVAMITRRDTAQKGDATSVTWMSFRDIPRITPWGGDAKRKSAPATAIVHEVGERKHAIPYSEETATAIPPEAMARLKRIFDTRETESLPARERNQFLIADPIWRLTAPNLVTVKNDTALLCPSPAMLSTILLAAVRDPEFFVYESYRPQ